MIGKTIKSLLAVDSTLTALVAATKVFPYVINSSVGFPAISYSVDSLDPEYNKGGWAQDEIRFSVTSYDDDYGDLQDIVVAVRGALELATIGSGTQEINRIYLTSQDEGFDERGFFYNKLGFKVIIHTY